MKTYFRAALLLAFTFGGNISSIIFQSNIFTKDDKLLYYLILFLSWSERREQAHAFLQQVRNKLKKPRAQVGVLNPGVLHPGVQDGVIHPAVQDGVLHPAVQDGVLHPGVQDGVLHPAVQDGVLHPAVRENDGTSLPRSRVIKQTRVI